MIDIVLFMCSHNLTRLAFDALCQGQNENGGEPISINLDRVSDAQIIADRLVGLPKEALLYIAGYAEGVRDKPKRRKKVQQKANEEKEARP